MGEVADQVHQRATLGRRHAGGRFIHQQQTRLIGQRHREIEPLQIAVRQHAASSPGLRRQSHLGQQPIGLVGLLQRGGAPEPPRTARPRDQRHLHVLTHRHRGEGLGHLESAPDAQAADRTRREAGNRATEQHHLPGIGAKLAADHVEAGGLARPVRSDQREHLAFGHGEGHVVHHARVTKRLSQSGRFQHRGAAHAGCRRNHTRLAAPTIPSGNATTSTTIASPRTKRHRSVLCNSTS